jgi:hypothetical protein
VHGGKEVVASRRDCGRASSDERCEMDCVLVLVLVRDGYGENVCTAKSRKM